MMSSQPQARPDINPWLIAVAVMSSTFMEVLDTTVVNVSLPHIAGNLSASTDEATWTLTSYLVANAIILSGGERHNPSDDGLVGQYFWTEAPADGIGHGLHNSVILLWPRSVAALFDHLSN